MVARFERPRESLAFPRTQFKSSLANWAKPVWNSKLIKLYGTEDKPENRYSPGKCLGAKKQAVMGEPDPDFISTSYAERQNLNIRMQNRRFTRLTNAFSKKADMLAYSIAIMFMY